MNWLLYRLKGAKMFKCNVCGAIFDKPLEQHREVEYYSRPFGNESEPYGGGYYDCCPECESEDFDRYEEDKEELNTLDELSVNGTAKIFTDKQPQITFANLLPKNQKVIIWGYELCNGAEWKDFLEVVNKLGKEKAELEKALKLACEQIWAMSIWENTKEEIIQDNIKFFKTKAKEMKNG